MRRIIGNLDFEQDLAEAGAISKAAAARIAPLATLLRVFAQDGDHLWTPGPVDSKLVTCVDGLPQVILESGPLDRLSKAAATLVWGQLDSNEFDALPGCEAMPGKQAPLHEHIWCLPRAPSAKARETNDRRFYLEVAREFGCALPGSEYFTDRAELERHVAAQTHARFVLKAPFSASGRARLVFERAAVSDPRVREKLDALFTAYGGGLLEPWMDRTDDFGALGLIARDGVAFLGLHRQHVTKEGQFVGITLRPFAVPDGLSKEDVAALTVAARRVGEALYEHGYRGPYSVDSWRYRQVDGKFRLQVIGEINARMTMGLVARVAAERVFGRASVDEVTLAIEDDCEDLADEIIVLLERPRVVLRRVAVE